MRYIQTYFECFKESGMNTVFQMYRMRGKQVIAQHKFDHCQYDGISAIVEMVREFPAEGFLPPKLIVKPKPSLFKRLLELMKWYVRFYPFMPSKWKSHSTDKTETVSGITQIEGWNYQHKISLNTRLLLTLDLTAREFLEKPHGKNHWMSPVGLYNGIDRELPPANRVSFIDLKIGPKTTLKELQDQSKTQLIELNYWGTILSMYFSVLLGKKPFLMFIKFMHLFFRRTGTFSFVGDWTIPGLPADEWWVAGEGCVARMSPVEGTAMIVNGRLGISVHADPSLGWSKDMAQAFVEKWKNAYLKLQ